MTALKWSQKSKKRSWISWGSNTSTSSPSGSTIYGTFISCTSLVFNKLSHQSIYRSGTSFDNRSFTSYFSLFSLRSLIFFALIYAGLENFSILIFLAWGVSIKGSFISSIGRLAVNFDVYAVFTDFFADVAVAAEIAVFDGWVVNPTVYFFFLFWRLDRKAVRVVHVNTFSLA